MSPEADRDFEVPDADTWMAQLAPQIGGRRLSEIVIPGSHDTATYGLDGADWDYAGTQNQSFTMTAALDHGVRAFDLRVKYKDWAGNAGADYWGFHNASISTRLRFGQLLDQVSRWTRETGREREIIVLNLGIDTEGGKGGSPPPDCKRFTDALGDALLTPRRLLRDHDLKDAGRVTPDQLYAMPGHPRVIMSDCMPAEVGSWQPALYRGYYANQCYADPYFAWATNFPGVSQKVREAAKVRGGTNESFADNFPGNATAVDSPLIGGLYNLNIQTTTTASCGYPLKGMTLPTCVKVLDDLLYQWANDAATRKNVNIISGDFVEETRLVFYAVGMNRSWPVSTGGASQRRAQKAPSLPAPDTDGPAPATTLTADGGNNQTTRADEPFPQPLTVKVTDDSNNPLAGQPVTFTVTRGEATFPALDEARLEDTTGEQLDKAGQGPRKTVTVPTDDNGIATAPALTARGSGSPIEVTATVRGLRSTTFNLRVSS